MFLKCLMGNMELLFMQRRGIGLHIQARGHLMVFLELQVAHGVYSQATARMILQVRVC